MELVRENVADISNSTDKLLTSMRCKQIRIGTHRFEPTEMVIFTCKGVKIYAPNCKNDSEIIPIIIYNNEIVKFITHFSKKINIVFIHTLKKCAEYIRESLDMPQKISSNDDCPYYSPSDRREPYKRIILEFDSVTEESKAVLRAIFERSVIEKITHVEANELLRRASVKDKPLETASRPTSDASMDTYEDIRQILIYPPGKGGISINTEDYMCLGEDQYLNDVIIDFYLKYVHQISLTALEQTKTHIFSTFFYKRLTSVTPKEPKNRKQAGIDRHNLVKNWTKNVNLFEKDYIIIPINEQSHWFLAIICFPYLKEPINAETQMTVPRQKLLKKRKPVNILIKKERRESEDEEDETEEESDFLSEDSEEDGLYDTRTRKTFPMKQPVILFFDSLMGASKFRVASTLRSYLTCEYQAKMKDNYIFNKANMPSQVIKVPQQNNYTDCGLYLLQFVEHFFNNPIQDYHMPINDHTDWFDSIVVTRKREEISELLKELVKKHNPDRLPLPQVPLPTRDGKLIEVKKKNKSSD